MAEFHHMMPTSSMPPTPANSFPYSTVSARYSPTTTVNVKLRQFEKEAKEKAECEYNADHGPLPEPAADDDLSVSATERLNQKKKRKVRSAVVSRRKQAIYVEKLVEELDLRGLENTDLDSKLRVFRDVLRETRDRINGLEKALELRKTDVQTKEHRIDTSMGEMAPPPGAESGSLFFLEPPQDNSLDDMLSICPEEIVCVGQIENLVPNRGHLVPLKVENVVVGADFVSERSDPHTSPVTPRMQSYEPEACELPNFLLRDSCWKPQAPEGHYHTPQQRTDFHGDMRM